MKRTIIIIAILFVALVDVPAQTLPSWPQDKHRFRYGDMFQAEEPLKNPVKIPSRILSRAFRDHGYQDQSLKEFEKTVAGTFIDLDGDRKTDFLVQGDTGANITGFWLFRNVGGRQQLVLHSRALGIYLLNATHKRMRDIEAAAATAITLRSVIYRFDGTEYRPYRCWSEDMGQDPVRRKKTYYRCHQ